MVAHSKEMLEIGITFNHCDDDNDGDGDEVEVTVGGYVYYENVLWYCCLTENGRNIDVHEFAAHEALNV